MNVRALSRTSVTMLAGAMILLAVHVASAAPLTGVAQISGGNGWTCATRSAGGLECWGENFNGQLGNGTQNRTYVPTSVTGLGAMADVAAGWGGHTCAVTAGGVVKCWGSNGGGQLGVNRDPNFPPYWPASSVPVTVVGGIVADDVATGGNFSCAIAGGTVVCWGDNTHHQLGQRNFNDPAPNPSPVASSHMPLAVPSIFSATAISAGSGHACALIASGSAMCWGLNGSGQLGTNSNLTSQRMPAGVEDVSGRVLGGFTSISAGSGHTCAVTSAGSVKCWGQNNAGQLGNGSTAPFVDHAVDVLDTQGKTLTGIRAVAAGSGFTCALTTDSRMRCWGNNAHFQFGINTNTQPAALPVHVMSSSGAGHLTGVGAITAGSLHACALMIDDSVKCWGHNGAGAAGAPAPITNPQPVGAQIWVTAPQDVGSIGPLLTVARAGTGRGHVSGSVSCGASCTPPAGLACPAHCAEAVPYGSTATLTATPAAGSVFVGWSASRPGFGCNQGITSPTCTFPFYMATVVTAEFARTTSDLDGDGTSDIVWQNSATGDIHVQLVTNHAISASAMVTPAGIGLDASWKIVAVNDIDADGKADVVLHDIATGQVYGLLMNGLAVGLEGLVYTQADLDWQIAGSGDFNGDGKADLLWRNSVTGDVYLLPLNGLVPGAGSVIYSEPDQSWSIERVADFNGDNRADILWRNRSTGDVFMQLMNGAYIVSGAVIYSEPNQSWQIQATADFDGNGRADIVWRNVSTGDAFMMLMDGMTILGGTVFYSEPNPAWRMAASSDYDGNRKADLLWRNASTGEVYMMQMNGTAVTGGSFIYAEPNQDWKILGP